MKIICLNQITYLNQSKKQIDITYILDFNRNLIRVLWSLV